MAVLVGMMLHSEQKANFIAVIHDYGTIVFERNNEHANWQSMAVGQLRVTTKHFLFIDHKHSSLSDDND